MRIRQHQRTSRSDEARKTGNKRTVRTSWGHGKRRGGEDSEFGRENSETCSVQRQPAEATTREQATRVNIERLLCLRDCHKRNAARRACRRPRRVAPAGASPSSARWQLQAAGGRVRRARGRAARRAGRLRGAAVPRPRRRRPRPPRRRRRGHPEGVGARGALPCGPSLDAERSDDALCCSRRALAAFRSLSQRRCVAQVAALPYLLPLLDGLRYSRYFFVEARARRPLLLASRPSRSRCERQFPQASVLLLPLQPLLQLYSSVPFFPLIIFFALYLGCVQAAFTRAGKLITVV